MQVPTSAPIPGWTPVVQKSILQDNQPSSWCFTGKIGKMFFAPKTCGHPLTFWNLARSASNVRFDSNGKPGWLRARSRGHIQSHRQKNYKTNINQPITGFSLWTWLRKRELSKYIQYQLFINVGRLQLESCLILSCQELLGIGLVDGTATRMHWVDPQKWEGFQNSCIHNLHI